MSKGSKRRPGKGFEDGWERIFGKKDNTQRKKTKNKKRDDIDNIHKIEYVIKHDER